MEPLADNGRSVNYATHFPCAHRPFLFRLCTGVQYACDEYVQELNDNELVPSMSATGHCYDNAFMESFFKTLKAEEVYLTEYETYEDVLAAVPQFIDAVYNKKRMHSSLGYTAPEEFERLWAKGVLDKHGIDPVLKLPGKHSN